jgi:hypothetical protein
MNSFIDNGDNLVNGKREILDSCIKFILELQRVNEKKTLNK